MSDTVEIQKAKLRPINMNFGGSVTLDPTSNKVQVPGHPYIMEATGDKILIAVDKYLSGYECKTCRGRTVLVEKVGFEPGVGQITKEVQCPDCKGKGHTLFIPETAKTLPTTGVVVSVGSEVKQKNIKPGVRILAGPYVGTMIPIKGGALNFKCMREHEVQLTIEGGDDLDAFDFIEIDAPIEGV